MKTVSLAEPGRFELLDTCPPGSPGPEAALVRVRRVGICGTDLHAYRGRQPFFTYPRILGHELGVEIVALGSISKHCQVGDICAVEPYLECGKCGACRRGKTNCCAHLKVLGVHIDGGMRELIQVPISKLHVSRKLSLEQLALVETLGIGAHAVQRAQLESSEEVLVIGAGPIGLSIMQFALLAGSHVRVLDINPDRLAFCRRHFGIVDLTQDPNEIISRELPTVIFDATGNPASMMESFNMIAPGGKLVFVGLFQGDLTFHDPLFHRREMTILSSRNAVSQDFTRIIELMEMGKIETRPWITHQCSMEELPSQFEGWLAPQARVVKAMATV